MAQKYVYDETYNVKGWFDTTQTSSGWFDTGFSEDAGAPPSTTGQIKVYSGTWVAKPIKWYNGSTWVIKPLKRWNGTSWVITPY